MRRILYRLIGVFAAGIFAFATASAQFQTDFLKHFGRGTELFHAGKYGAAMTELEKAAREASTDDAPYAAQLRYQTAICAAELGQDRAEYMLNAFLTEYPHSIYSNDVRFAAAGYLYDRDEWDAASLAYRNVNPYELPAAKQDEFFYKSAHTAFMQERYDEAYTGFRQVDPAGDYGEHALYYRSYIEYARGNYNAAKQGFIKLVANDAYARLIPYYLLQIEFLQGNYRYVADHGDALMQGATQARAAEAARLLAESWFHLGDYGRTLAYMDQYQSLGGAMARQELYMDGYAAYMEAYYPRAIASLAPVAAGDDRLAQNASYHLAGAYLKTGDKPRAMQSFMLASAADFDDMIREDALFNYGKLQYELGGGAFGEAINVLNRYLKAYPNSVRANEAREYLIAAYYNSENYDAAWEAISLIPNPDNNIRTAYQKIAYFRALDYFNAGDYDRAAATLDLSLANRYNPKYTALANFWKAEILMRRGEFDKAVPLFREYVRLSPAGEPEHPMAHYDLGYAYFNLRNWDAAQEWFDKFLKLYPAQDSYRADAYNREGDIQFAGRAYWKAIGRYDEAIKLGTGERFYAQLQRAVMLGLVDRADRKIEILQEIIASGQGDYVDEAMYELGRTYIAAQRYQDGAAILKRYVDAYPDGGHYLSALSDLGLVYQNLGDNKQALNYYKTVVEKAPASPQARDAMLVIRGMYVDQNDVDGYFAFAKRSGLETDLSAIQRDSLAYAAAERVYLSGDSKRAVSALQGYLDNYPKGAYRANALYNLSESSLRDGNRAGAIAALEELSGIYQNEFTVRGLEQLAALTYEDKNYAAAARAYKKLTGSAATASGVSAAWGGYMRSVSAQGDADAAIRAADEVLAAPQADKDVRRQAQFAKAKALDRKGRAADALKIYGVLSAEGRTPEGAEATYRVIESKFRSGDAAGAEKLIYGLTDQNSQQSYWVAKSFLILGDIFAAKGDAFQARATWQSIVEGYAPANDGVVDEARARIKALK